MQIVETANEGLKRAYTVKIPAKEIAARIDAEVKKVAPQVRMPGFRPGKVPANLIKKMHGAALHSDAFNASVANRSTRLMSEKKLRPALQPEDRSRPGLRGRQGRRAQGRVEVLPEFEGALARRSHARTADRAGLRRAARRGAAKAWPRTRPATATRQRPRRPRRATS
jgi:trigger factor